MKYKSLHLVQVLFVSDHASVSSPVGVVYCTCHAPLVRQLFFSQLYSSAYNKSTFLKWVFRPFHISNKISKHLLTTICDTLFRYIYKTGPGKTINQSNLRTNEVTLDLSLETFYTVTIRCIDTMFINQMRYHDSPSTSRVDVKEAYRHTLENLIAINKD